MSSVVLPSTWNTAGVQMSGAVRHLGLRVLPGSVPGCLAQPCGLGRLLQGSQKVTMKSSPDHSSSSSEGTFPPGHSEGIHGPVDGRGGGRVGVTGEQAW